MSEWISVKDRLPAADMIVLIRDKEMYRMQDGSVYSGVMQAIYRNETWLYKHGRGAFIEPDQITHWMPYCGDPKEPMTLQEVVTTIESKELPTARMLKARMKHDGFNDGYAAGLSDCWLLIKQYAEENNIS